MIKMGRASAEGSQVRRLGKVDFGFGFDDKEGVGGRVAGGVEFLEGFVEELARTEKRMRRSVRPMK